MVKRLPDESAKVFATRCRPLYSWYTDEMGEKTIESTEWSEEKAVVAFYTQKYKLEKEDPKIKDGKRILAYLFMPAGKGLYKRIFIDTFSNDEKPVTITSAFFANADSDPAKELVILTTTPWRDPQSNGTLYTTHIYDNIPGRPFPARLKSLDDAANKVAGGLDGMSNNKATRPKCKNEKDVREALKKLGME
jgi:hypothetical protein